MQIGGDQGGVAERAGIRGDVASRDRVADDEELCRGILGGTTRYRLRGAAAAEKEPRSASTVLTAARPRSGANTVSTRSWGFIRM
jgi:hypothetical protein